MPNREEILNLHKLINQNIIETKDQVQNIFDRCNNTHWLSVGESKETIMKKIIRSSLAENTDNLKIGSGFIVSDNNMSTQIDIIIYDKNKSPLFCDEDFIIATPDMVKAIIEVKSTYQGPNWLTSIVEKMIEIPKTLDINNLQTYNIWKGIYVFDNSSSKDKRLSENTNNEKMFWDLPTKQQKKIKEVDTRVLNVLKNNSIVEFDNYHRNFNTINCVTIASNRFYRFWETRCSEDNSSRTNPSWHSYYLKDLAPAYFISNVIGFCLNWNIQSELFFPLIEGKKAHCTSIIEM